MGRLGFRVGRLRISGSSGYGLFRVSGHSGYGLFRVRVVVGSGCHGFRVVRVRVGSGFRVTEIFKINGSGRVWVGLGRAGGPGRVRVCHV